MNGRKNSIMSSHGLVIRDHVSDIHTTIFPAIHLDTEKTYEIGLIQFSVFNSTFNITRSNNKLYYYDNRKQYVFGGSGIYEPICITIPPGLYNLDSLVSAISQLIPESTLHIVRISDSGYYILHATNIHPVFTRSDSILQVFGFPTS